MDQNTIDMNRQASTSQIQDSFVYRHRKILFWTLLIGLMAITWYFSRSLETRGTGTASVFFSGSEVSHTIPLDSKKVEPISLSIRAGDSVEFVVHDEGLHFIAERKTVSRRGDARISSGEFGPGESYSIQFNTPGSFSFYDRMNQDISIDIEVR